MECEFLEKNINFLKLFLSIKFFFINEYDATYLVKNYNGQACRIFIDQGSDDQFLKQNQLLSDNIVEASKENASVQVDLRYQDVSFCTSKHLKKIEISIF